MSKDRVLARLRLSFRQPRKKDCLWAVDYKLTLLRQLKNTASTFHYFSIEVVSKAAGII